MLRDKIWDRRGCEEKQGKEKRQKVCDAIYEDVETRRSKFQRRDEKQCLGHVDIEKLGGDSQVVLSLKLRMSQA